MFKVEQFLFLSIFFLLLLIKTIINNYRLLFQTFINHYSKGSDMNWSEPRKGFKSNEKLNSNNNAHLTAFNTPPRHTETKA